MGLNAWNMEINPVTHKYSQNGEYFYLWPSRINASTYAALHRLALHEPQLDGNHSKIILYCTLRLLNCNSCLFMLGVNSDIQ